MTSAGTDPSEAPAGGGRWHRLLSEAWRSMITVVVGIVIALVWLLGEQPPIRSLADLAPWTVDAVIAYLAIYLTVYPILSVGIFTRAPDEAIAGWAKRTGRGTWLQRYVLGTTPGPGLSISMSAIALVVAVVWLPHGDSLGSTFSDPQRLAVSILVMIGAWTCLLVSFAIAYFADNLLQDGAALDFPGPDTPGWSDYIYLSAAVSSTFGTTDVTVTSRTVRRMVTVHGIIAFVFNTIILGTVVGLLA